MSLSPRIRELLKKEETALHESMKTHGLFVNKRTYEEVENAFLQFHLSIPDVMAKWDLKQPTLIMLINDAGKNGTLYYTDLVASDPNDEPVMFAFQDYQRHLEAESDGAPVPMIVSAIGFLGECIRGAVGGSVSAKHHLSALLRIMFPQQNRLLLQVKLGEDAGTPTLSIEGYYTDE